MTDIAERLRTWLAEGRFQSFLGAELVAHDAEAGRVELRVPWRDSFERGPGTTQWHGGPIAALIDVAGDFALIAKLGYGVPTIDLRVDYLRPAIGTSLNAKAHARRVGRTIGCVDIEVTDDAGRLVAVGRGNYATTRPA